MQRYTVRSWQSRVMLAATIAVGGATLDGCASLNNKERGAIIGAASGAAAGGAIGSKNGGTARGAIIGAVVGGTAGAVIGHQMDQRAKELEQNIKNARVERVGDLHLLVGREGDARRLLAVSQGGVENRDPAVPHWLLLRSGPPRGRTSPALRSVCAPRGA